MADYALGLGVLALELADVLVEGKLESAGDCSTLDPSKPRFSKNNVKMVG